MGPPMRFQEANRAKGTTKQKHINNNNKKEEEEKNQIKMPPRIILQSATVVK